MTYIRYKSEGSRAHRNSDNRKLNFIQIIANAICFITKKHGSVGKYLSNVYYNPTRPRRLGGTKSLYRDVRYGKYGTKLTNSFIRKISPLLKSHCKFIVNWKTTMLTASSHLKSKYQKCIKASLSMKFKCLGCNAN